MVPVLQELENTSLTADPPAEPIDSQKLASLGVLTELMVGFLFAIGLGVSGMVKPSKVAAFLSVLAGRRACRRAGGGCCPALGIPGV